MVRLYVNVQFQVKPLSTGTSSSRTIFFFKNTCMDPSKMCTKFGVSSTSLSLKSRAGGGGGAQDPVEPKPN